MSRFILLIVVLLLLTFPVSTQDEPVALVVAQDYLDNASAAEAANGADPVVRSVGVRANFTLTDQADTVDATPGDGTCADAGGACTLRAAVMESNALGGSNTINIPGGYSITLSLGTTNDNNANSGDLDILANVEIIGTPGGGQPRITNIIEDRIFHVFNVGIALSLQNVMLREAGAPGVSGGAVLVTGGVFRSDRISVYGNTGHLGGGIAVGSGATFDIYNSTFAYNMSFANGAGIYMQNATGSIVNSTVFGNFSPLINGTSYPGAGLFFFAPTTVDVIHTTVTQNYNGLYGGGFSVYNPSTPAVPVTFTNSVIADNDSGYQAPDCHMFAGSVQPKADYVGFNVIGYTDYLCESLPGPALQFEPVEFGLIVNTGHPYIIPPSPGSVTINAALSCLPILGGVDQMGNPRPAGSGCDLGSYERPTRNDGTIDIAPPSGVPLSAFTVKVDDVDLMNTGALDVQVVTQNTVNPDSETVTLVETPPNSGTFEALVTLSPSPATPGNGLIEAGLGHEVVVSYWDAVTANADAATRTATYTVVPPVAANLLTNGDFEAGATGWTFAGPTSDKVNGKSPFDGLKSLRFKGFAGKPNSKVGQTVLAPPVVDGDTLVFSAQIESGAAASGKMKFKLKTDQDRQIKADVKFDKSGAYGLHEIILPIALLPGEMVTEVSVMFTDKSQSGKVYVDAVSLTVTAPNAPRTETRAGILPPPVAPSGFRGGN
ncbi:MAG: right-handed parallel beta-helix repeat-containing protein [Chloroflexi bacterium]|nr:right-handed parallel beta-helix repeat-containing protein [Chloroflexota bacterium]